MPIKVGDKLPDATLMTMSDAGPKPVKTGDLFAGRKVVVCRARGIKDQSQDVKARKAWLTDRLRRL